MRLQQLAILLVKPTQVYKILDYYKLKIEILNHIEESSQMFDNG